MNIARKNGITLTELLVASILIGVVMIGVASFSVSIQQLQSATNRSVILSMRATGVMNRMVKDAYSAVGDAANPGVYSDGPDWLCLRRDTDNDPSSYDSNGWTCYFGRGGQTALWRCGNDVIYTQSNWGSCQRGAGATLLLDLESTDITTGVGSNGVGISIQAIFDQQQAFHPIQNPRYRLESTVHPPGHSW